MSRTIKHHPARAEEVPVSSAPDLRWLQRLANEHGLRWLLAHADDGVIWGKVEAGLLLTSHDAARQDARASRYCPPLRPETLQQARLFGCNAELLVWGDGAGGWRARLIRDTEANDAHWLEVVDESQLLWGTSPLSLPQGFTLWTEGAQGLRHAVPLPANPAGPPRLVVRHYLAREDFARIAASRLVELEHPAEDHR